MEKKQSTKKGNRAASVRVNNANVVDNLLNALINVGGFVYSQPTTISTLLIK